MIRAADTGTPKAPTDLEALAEILKNITDPVVAELVGTYIARDGRIHPRFTKKLKEQPVSVEREVRKWIHALSLDDLRKQVKKGYSRPPKPKELRKKILEDQEWDQLAGIVFGALYKQTGESIVSLANKAMSQLPKHRQRKLTGNNIWPLHDRIQARMQRLRELEARAEGILNLTDPHIREQFTEQVLQTVTPEQLLERFEVEAFLKHVSTEVLFYHAMYRSIGLLRTAAATTEKLDRIDQRLASLAQIVSASKTSNNGRQSIVVPHEHAKPSPPRLPKVVCLLSPMLVMQQPRQSRGVPPRNRADTTRL